MYLYSILVIGYNMVSKGLIRYMRFYLRILNHKPASLSLTFAVALGL